MSVSTKYVYNGFTPLRRITGICQIESHDSCRSGIDEMLKFLSVDEAKKYCCLCQCHFSQVGA